MTRKKFNKNLIKISFILVFLIALILFTKGVLANSCVGENYLFTCGDTINESCFLDGDIIANTFCFEIGSDNLILDCMNYSIIANIPYVEPGIKSNNKNNIVIKNCKIYYFAQGIYSINTSYSSFENNWLNHNGDTGIMVSYGEKNVFLENTANNNTNSGYYVEYSKDNLFLKNTANENRRGFDIYLGSENTTILENIAKLNDYQGIITECSNTKIINNLAMMNSQGISILRGFSHNNIIANNTVMQNSETGILLDESNLNQITFNFISSNNDGLFVFYGSNNNNITNNNITNNTGNGIYLGSGPNLIINNTLINNQYGINIQTSSNTINNNTINGSGEWDIYTAEGTTNNITETVIKNIKTNFSYAGQIKIKGTEPFIETNSFYEYPRLSKYLSITNFSNAWVYLNISYEDEDWQSLNILDENTLKIWRYSNNFWNNDLGTPINGVDTSANYVYANITNFDKINILGQLTCFDSTYYNSCSTTKPLFCQNGQLINRCTICGCRPLYQCNALTDKCIFRKLEPQVAIKD